MKEFIKVMKALSDPNRLKILKLLQQQALCVCELQAALDIAQSTVSNHLKVLENAELVGSRKEGLWAYYNLTDGSSTPYAAVLLGSLKHWLRDDPEICRIIEDLPAKIRQRIAAGTDPGDRGKASGKPLVAAKCCAEDL